MNVIVTMLFAELDSAFQSILPNGTSGVVSPGTGKMAGANTTKTSVGGSSQGQDVASTEGGATLNVESNSITAMAGGGGSPLGRAEVDPFLEQTFYLIPSERQRPRMLSQVLIQDVMVLQVGDFAETQQKAAQQAASLEQTSGTQATQPPPQGGTQTTAQTTAQQQKIATTNPDLITLIVTPQDAVTLNYLVYGGGKLTLALRSAGDDSRVQTEAVTLQFLLDQYKIPIPAKLPYGLEPRVDQIVSPVLPNDSAQQP